MAAGQFYHGLLEAVAGRNPDPSRTFIHMAREAVRQGREFRKRQAPRIVVWINLQDHE
jgi:hypothetical protein